MLHAGATVGSYNDQVGINLAPHVQNDFKPCAKGGMSCGAQSIRLLLAELVQLLDGLSLNVFFKNQKGLLGYPDALVLIQFVNDVQAK
jgi:hypothetical protein